MDIEWNFSDWSSERTCGKDLRISGLDPDWTVNQKMYILFARASKHNAPARATSSAAQTRDAPILQQARDPVHESG